MSVSTLQPALPKHMYVDDAYWRHERDRVLHRSWFCVGRLDDLGLDQAGRLAVVDVVGESVLVTSDQGGELHAAYNVCRHRGSQIVPVDPAAGPPPGCAVGALRCPYHSWTYDLAGRLLKAPHANGVATSTRPSSGCIPSASTRGAASASCTSRPPTPDPSQTRSATARRRSRLSDRVARPRTSVRVRRLCQLQGPARRTTTSATTAVQCIRS